jgi:ankyrin repeat protein
MRMMSENFSKCPKGLSQNLTIGLNLKFPAKTLNLSFLTDGDTSTQSQSITALYAATVCDNIKVMSLLLQFGADPNQKYASKQTSASAIADTCTPLLQAVMNGSPVAVSLLIKVSQGSTSRKIRDIIPFDAEIT